MGSNKRKTIAEHMVDILNEEGEEYIDVGRPWLWDECIKRSGMDTTAGSVRLGSRVMDAIEKSGMFEKSYIRYRTRARLFKLKEEYKDGNNKR